MATVVIYRVSVQDAFGEGKDGHCFSLFGWGGNSVKHKGCDDGGEIYVLPDGYTVHIDSIGLPVICNPQGKQCLLVTEIFHPCLCDRERPWPFMMLRLASLQQEVSK